MAKLKDTVVSGNLRVTEKAMSEDVQAKIIKAPTSSGGSTFGQGSNGQVIKSNGSSIYWAADNNSMSGVKGNSESSYRTGQVNITAANIGAVAIAQGTTHKGKFLRVDSSGNIELVAL